MYEKEQKLEQNKLMKTTEGSSIRPGPELTQSRSNWIKLSIYLIHSLEYTDNSKIGCQVNYTFKYFRNKTAFYKLLINWIDIFEGPLIQRYFS